MVGCSHHTAPVEVREKLAFSREQATEALTRFRSRYPQAEAVLLSTCNRVELYFASEAAEACPTHDDAVAFLAEFHGVKDEEVFNKLFEHTGEDFVRHLFTVAASLDSMVVGEAQLVVSATGSNEPIMTAADFRPIVAERYQRPLLILDLAIPRDFDPAIGQLTGVYLYSIDDLQAACEKNRREREQEWPRAER